MRAVQYPNSSDSLFFFHIFLIHFSLEPFSIETTATSNYSFFLIRTHEISWKFFYWLLCSYLCFVTCFFAIFFSCYFIILDKKIFFFCNLWFSVWWNAMRSIENTLFVCAAMALKSYKNVFYSEQRRVKSFLLSIREYYTYT